MKICNSFINTEKVLKIAGLNIECKNNVRNETKIFRTHGKLFHRTVTVKQKKKNQFSHKKNEFSREILWFDIERVICNF